MRTATRFSLAAAIAAVVVLPRGPIGAAQIIAADPPVHVSVDDRERQMGELDLAADPVDPRRLLTCAMTYSDEENRSWISAYLTEDRGRTWRRVLETRGPRRRMEADPACAFDRRGRAYVTAMSNPWVGSFSAEQHLFLYRSIDRGVTWTKTMAMVITGMAFDREYLVVDNTGGERAGTLYMNAIASPRGRKDAKDGEGVGLWTSRDGSGTFDVPAFHPAISGRPTLQRANSVMLSDGTVAFLFSGKMPKPVAVSGGEVMPLTTALLPDAELRLGLSSDGGRSVQVSDPIADVYVSTSLGFGAQIPWLAADPGSVTFKDRLYVTWSDARSGRSEILLAHSDDRGRTWSAPVYVNDDHGHEPIGRAGEHSLPVVSANRDGVVGVMWYDRRSAPESFGWEIRFAASLDGGQTFLPSVLLSSAPSGFGPELRLHPMAYVDDRIDARYGHGVQVRIQGRQFYAGDTAGMAADAAGAFHPMWLDHASGIPQVWTTTVSVDARGIDVRDGVTALDVSSAVTLEFDSTFFDQLKSEATVTVVLRNVSSEPLPLPLTMKIQGLSSELAESVEVLNADNGLAGLDATWVFGDESVGLEPHAATKPRQLRFKLTKRRSYRTPTGYRSGLVAMHVRVLAPVR